MKQLNYCLITLLFSIALAACGGGGGGRTSPPQVFLTGTVNTPSGQVAQRGHPSWVQRVANFIVPDALASISNLLPVADGTEVQLVRVSDSGAIISALDSTSTQAGQYSFNLTSLEVTPASDLVVLVSGSGVQMRAIVTSTQVDLNPVSEAIARLVFDTITSTPNRFLSDFTINEVANLYEVASFLASLNTFLPTTNIDITANGIIELVKNNSDFLAYLNAVESPGEASIGAGDVVNLFPLAAGNQWSYKVESSDQANPYFDSFTVTGTRVLNGVTVTVLEESNSDNSAIVTEEYLQKNDQGIFNWGNNDAQDIITPELIPYQMTRFPVSIGISEENFNLNGLSWNEDIDGDGKNEVFDTQATLVNTAIGTISTPIGDFANTLRSQIDLALNVRLSGNDDIVSTTNQMVEWRSPNVGLIKIQQNINASGPGGTVTTTETHTLRGYRVNGLGRGVLEPFTLINSIATPNSNTEFPGRAAVGSGGDNFLVVSCRETTLGSPSGVVGTLVTANGDVGPLFHIANHTCFGFHADVEFDGVNYLLVFQRYDGGNFGNPELFGVRISGNGTVIDTNDGFTIATGPETTTPAAIAFDGDNYLVVYGKFSLSGGNLWDVYASRVSTNGQLIGELPIVSSPGDQLTPDVSYDGTNYLVTWESTPTGSGPSLDTDVMAARVSKTGVVIDPTGFAVADMANYQGGARVSFDGTNFMVVWQETESFFLSPPVSRLYGRRIKPDATLLDGSSGNTGIVIQSQAISRGGTSMIYDGKNFFLTWSDRNFNIAPNAGIFSFRISSEGVLLDSLSDSNGLEISGTPPDATLHVHPVIKFNGSHSLVVWNSNKETVGQFKELRGVFVYPY